LPSYNPKPLWWHFLFKLLKTRKKEGKNTKIL